MRFVFIHNHIFKNAGSTIDRAFAAAGFRCHALEPGTTVHPRMIVETVRADPSVEYLSSHLLAVPRPEDLEDVGFVDITFLRHPLDRFLSLYSYSQQPGVEDFAKVRRGATFAEFTDIVEAEYPAHFHSPQTVCMGNERRFYFPPGVAHFEAARSRILETRFLGIVDLVDASFETFRRCCGPLLAGKDLRAFAPPLGRVNASAAPERMDERLERVRADLGEHRHARLAQANELDLELYLAARGELLRRRHPLVPLAKPRARGPEARRGLLESQPSQNDKASP